MKQSYPVYPPYPTRTVLVVEALGEVSRPSFINTIAFTPLTWVGDNPHVRRRRACDCFLLQLHTFDPRQIIHTQELTVKKNRTLPDYEFINYKLEEDRKEEFMRWAQTNANRFWELMSTLSESGYKLSVSPDLDNECIIATLTATKHSAQNNGYCLSSRSDDVQEAVWLSLYKHFIVFDGGTWDASTVKSNWG